MLYYSTSKAVLRMNSLSLIGHTPMFEYQKNIYIKLEKYNLGGSVKDRAVLGMIEAAQKTGKLKPDTVLVEASSGNTGISLAIIGRLMGYRVIIVMPESMSIERRKMIASYGAELILTPKSGGMQASIDQVNELLAANTNYLNLGQFDNVAMVQKHYDTTAVEIMEQVPDLGVFVACSGTGGTITGVAKRLKAEGLDVITVLGEPAGSPLLTEKKTGPHAIQGIGPNFVPSVLDLSVVDEIMTISDEEAIRETLDFTRETGISVGISSGANIALAKKLALRYPNRKIVTVAPDGGDKYLSVLDFGV